jgi:hypothetical protein
MWIFLVVLLVTGGMFAAVYLTLRSLRGDCSTTPEETAPCSSSPPPTPLTKSQP